MANECLVKGVYVAQARNLVDVITNQAITYDDNCDHIHGCINNNDSMIEKKIFLQNYITKFEISEYGIYTLYGGDSNIWIIKPVGLSCGKKISCVSGLYHLLTVLKTMNYKCVIQKYIERPLLLRNKKKFDIRQWILITSVDPLIVYGYSECYIRLSVREFSLDEEKLIDPTIHLCNHAIQKHAIVTPSLLSSLSSSSSSSSMSSSSTIFPSIPIKDYQATHQHVKHNNTSNNQDDNSNPTTVTLINNEQEIVIKHDNNDNDHDDLPYCESMMSQSEFQKCLNEGYYKKKVITNSLSLEKKTTIPDNDENTNYSNKSNDNRYKKFDVYKTFILPQIKKIVIASIESVRDKLQRIGKGFEWLGLDLMVVESDNDNENYDDDDIEINIPHSMIDSNNNTDNQNGICQHGDNNENKRNEKEYNPYTVLLLEINVSPDISLSTPITTRLVPPAVTDLFDLLLDRKAADNPIEAAKMADNEINGVDSVNNLEESDTNKGQNNSGGISREERNINNNINTSSYSSSSCSSNSSSSNSGGNSNSNSNGVSVNSNNTHTNSKSSGKLKWDLWHIGPLRGKRELLSFGRKKQEYLSLGAIGDYEPRKVEIIDKVFQILEYNRKKNDIPVDVLMKESVLCALPTTVQVINTNQSSTDSQVVANNTIPDVLMNTNNDQEVDEDEI